MIFDKLEEFQQIDDLVIAPIANIRPRIVGFNGFPIETAFGHAVGVIAVKSGCIEKFVNHSLNELWVGMR